jgi:transcriptional regulator with XRE-family HTH domain
MDAKTHYTPTSIGEQLRIWRERRHMSQLALGLRAEVSSRHLSFVETGRSQPGRELILRLADELEIPLRERNTLLMCAGYSPMFEARKFDDPAFDSIRSIVDLTLQRHKPFPAYVLDRHWNVVRSNSAVQELYEGVAADLMKPPVNVVRLILHPLGMSSRIENYTAWRAHFVALLRRQVEMTADPQLELLLRETLSYPAGDIATEVLPAGPAIPLLIKTRLGRLSFIGATTVFGSPADVTLEEIALEVMHPADSFTEAAVRATT